LAIERAATVFGPDDGLEDPEQFSGDADERATIFGFPVATRRS